MDYIIIYTGTITKSGRESGLPDSITAYAFVQTTSRQGLANAVDGEMVRFINMRGMCVSDDPARMTDTQQIDLEHRMFVPMDQIMHIKASVRPISGGITVSDEEAGSVQ